MKPFYCVQISFFGVCEMTLDILRMLSFKTTSQPALTTFTTLTL